MRMRRPEVYRKRLVRELGENSALIGKITNSVKSIIVWNIITGRMLFPELLYSHVYQIEKTTIWSKYSGIPAACCGDLGIKKRGKCQSPQINPKKTLELTALKRP